MNDNRAEETIRRKVREHESTGGLLEGQAALWAALDERLEQKPVPSRRPFFISLAAASVVFLLVLGFYLYPARKTGRVPETATIKPEAGRLPAELGVQQESGVQQEESTTTASPAAQQRIAVRRLKKAKIATQEQKESEREKPDDPAAAYAGLYAMPQIAGAEEQLDQYPLCSQIL
ncbi:MAG: hypothetical protein JNL13_04310 [Chitinophagaceae bacterium]|nr:hypothetical protein [Chitinophagaceae bacterium]